MLSLSNCSTRLQMAPDIPFRRTSKGQKKRYFLIQRSGISSKIKTAATIVSFMHGLKKEICEELQ